MIPANDNSHLSVDEVAYTLAFGGALLATPAIVAYCAFYLGWL